MSLVLVTRVQGSKQWNIGTKLFPVHPETGWRRRNEKSKDKNKKKKKFCVTRKPKKQLKLNQYNLVICILRNVVYLGPFQVFTMDFFAKITEEVFILATIVKRKTKISFVRRDFSADEIFSLLKWNWGWYLPKHHTFIYC